MFNIRKRFKVIIILLLVTSGVIFSQEKLSLTIDRAIEIGLENSKTLHSSYMNVKSYEAKEKETDASLLPSLKLKASYKRLSEVDPFIISTPFGEFPISPSILDNYSTQLTLSQQLFTGFRLKSQSEIAELTSSAVKEQYNADKSNLIYNIKNAYWSLFKAQQLKKVVDENVDQFKAHLTDAKNMMSVGMMTNNDVLKIEVQLSDAMFRQSDAENAVQLAKVGLANVLGISLSTDFEIASSTEINVKKYDELNSLVEKAVEIRPEVKAADYMVKAGESNVTIAKSGWYPQLSLEGNFYYSRPNQRIVPAEDKFNDTWDVGINLNMNIWDWMTTAHKTDQAQASLAQSVDALGSIKDGVTLEVTQNFLNMQQGKNKIEISELTVKQALENMRVTDEKFKSGLALSSDLIDAEVALLQAKTNYTNSLVDFELSKARLEKSIGQ